MAETVQVDLSGNVESRLRAVEERASRASKAFDNFGESASRTGKSGAKQMTELVGVFAKATAVIGTATVAANTFNVAMEQFRDAPRESLSVTAIEKFVSNVQRLLGVRRTLEEGILTLKEREEGLTRRANEASIEQAKMLENADKQRLAYEAMLLVEARKRQLSEIDNEQQLADLIHARLSVLRDNAEQVALTSEMEIRTAREIGLLEQRRAEIVKERNDRIQEALKEIAQDELEQIQQHLHWQQVVQEKIRRNIEERRQREVDAILDVQRAWDEQHRRRQESLDAAFDKLRQRQDQAARGGDSSEFVDRRPRPGGPVYGFGPMASYEGAPGGLSGAGARFFPQSAGSIADYYRRRGARGGGSDGIDSSDVTQLGDALIRGLNPRKLRDAAIRHAIGELQKSADEAVRDFDRSGRRFGFYKGRGFGSLDELRQMTDRDARRAQARIRRGGAMPDEHGAAVADVGQQVIENARQRGQLDRATTDTLSKIVKELMQNGRDTNEALRQIGLIRQLLGAAGRNQRGRDRQAGLP